MAHRTKRQKTAEADSDDLCNCFISKKYEPKPNIDKEFLKIEYKLCKKLMLLNYGSKVSYIYNPLDYAKELHELYVQHYCQGIKEVLLLGMNPGPWGMCQTGVPFGQVGYVRDWLKLTGDVKTPLHQHELRPVHGLNCHRNEVSGERLWKLLEELSEKPENLFRHVFVHNYCPVAFLASTGKNITPVDLKAQDRKPLEEACDEALIETIKLLQVKYLVGIGKYVVDHARKALQNASITDVEVISMMHPSPANPTANKNWKEIARNQLKDAQLLRFINCDKY